MPAGFFMHVCLCTSGEATKKSHLFLAEGFPISIVLIINFLVHHSGLCLSAVR